MNTSPVWFLALGILAFSSSLSLAQNRFSTADVSAGNPTNTSGGFFHPLDQQLDLENGSLVQASAETTFSGVDSQSNPQTMMFAGSASARSDFGGMQTYASGSVINTYYNEENPVYSDPETGDVNLDGSPDQLFVGGHAGFSDILQYGGILVTGYRARYVFYVDGFISGDSAFGLLSVRIANHPQEQFFTPDDYVGYFQTHYSTASYPVSGTIPETVTASFFSSFQIGLPFRPEGASLSGTADFSATATLARIELLDEQGNLVPSSQWSVTSASGTSYLIPEPSFWALIVLPTAIAAVSRRPS